MTEDFGSSAEGADTQSATDEAVLARADAEYAALPGTPPDGWSFIPETDLQDPPYALIRARIDLWKPEMTWFRLTDTTGEFNDGSTPAGVWIEAWKVEPRKQAAFNPPLVAKATTAPEAGSVGTEASSEAGVHP